MADPTLSTVTQEQFDAAEAVVIDLIRAAHPTLDLRKGTVLRDLLIRPDAQMYALNTDRLEELRRQMSLLTVDENGTASEDELNALLANFNITLNPGVRAQGLVKVSVDADRSYTMNASDTFINLEGLIFNVSQDVVISLEPAAGELPLRQSEDGNTFFFIVPVIAELSGEAYTLEQGSALDMEDPFFGYITGSAYADFSLGESTETTEAVIERLPAAIAHRAFESRASIEAKLRDFAEEQGFAIKAVSSQGYGDRTQLRDKHNPFGLAVGSRVDTYVRSFAAPAVQVLRKTATKIANGSYQFVLARDEAPGYYAIKSISEVESVIAPDFDFGAIPAIGSYAFLESRTGEDVLNTFHDIDVDNQMVETAFSAWQTATVTVSGVPSTSADHEFKVELFIAPALQSMQLYVDDFDQRNLESDLIVRTPLICLVGVQARMYHDAKIVPDVDKIRTELVDYINSRSFVERLTRSELACIILANDITRVDLGPAGMELQGTVLDAKGVIHALSGDSLNIETIADPYSLLAPETVVFAAEPRNISLEPIPE